MEREWEPVTYFRTSPNTLVWSLVLAHVLLTVSLIGLSAGRLAAAELSDQLAARPSSDADECFELALSIPYLFRMGKEAEAIACYERLLQLSRKWMVAS